ncbi:protein IMPACT-like [Lineus longissimus]|uniref:protein IMPACT-like n=1 Tax=Lineus longissimus TaxID=88925 RepID=UPI002B4F2340
MESEDNISRQADEIEALSAIYGDEWCVIDEDAHTFCIRIDKDEDAKKNAQKLSVCLQIIFPPNYPSDCPPIYQINAPWLKGDERIEMENAMGDVYIENVGESIVYLWVEKIREVLQGRESRNGDQVVSGRKNISLETDDGDDEFDLTMVAQYHYQPDTAIELVSNKDAVECPPIYHGEPLTDRRSTFQPHLAPVLYKEQVDMVLRKLYENKKIANATHNIMAYRIFKSEPSPRYIQGCDDDGETHAGSRVLHLLQITDVQNVMVVVTRWYGGILLGPDRFKHINNCARNILEAHDYIHSKDDKKGQKKSSKKGKK